MCIFLIFVSNGGTLHISIERAQKSVEFNFTLEDFEEAPHQPVFAS